MTDVSVPEAHFAGGNEFIPPALVRARDHTARAGARAIFFVWRQVDGLVNRVQRDVIGHVLCPSFVRIVFCKGGVGWPLS